MLIFYGFSNDLLSISLDFLVAFYIFSVDFCCSVSSAGSSSSCSNSLRAFALRKRAAFLGPARVEMTAHRWESSTINGNLVPLFLGMNIFFKWKCTFETTQNRPPPPHCHPPLGAGVEINCTSTENH